MIGPLQKEAVSQLLRAGELPVPEYRFVELQQRLGILLGDVRASFDSRGEFPGAAECRVEMHLAAGVLFEDFGASGLKFLLNPSIAFDQ